PLGVGLINADPEDDALVAGRAEPTVLLKWRKGVLGSANSVLQRPEEQMPAFRAQEGQPVFPVSEADLAASGPHDLVTQVAMHAAPLAGLKERPRGRQGRGVMTRSAHLFAVG